MSPGSMRHIKYTASGCPGTGGTILDAVGRSRRWRGINSTLITRTGTVLSVTERGRGEGIREGGRVVILYNEGWEHILVDGTF